MSEEVQKKSGITFEYDRTEHITTIIATATDSELPLIAATLEMVIKSKVWRVLIDDFTNACPICDAVCFRGRSFAERLAREMIRGVYSRLGKHRRMTANKQKNAEVKHD